MINNENKLWKKSLILTIISFVFQILYTGIGIESFILIYVPQENLQALALLILLPLLIFICIIIRLKNNYLRQKIIDRYFWMWYT